MIGLSKKETEVIADLEFQEKYFFVKEDIEKHFLDKKQMSNTLHLLKKKKRIIKLNRSKYYLIPIKARNGKWSVHPFRIIDEIMNGKDYFIGGWAAGNFWQLTDQIPMKYEVYTTRRQGTITVLNTTIIFKRTTKKNLEKTNIMDSYIDKRGYIRPITFKILSKEESAKWLKSRD